MQDLYCMVSKIIFHQNTCSLAVCIRIIFFLLLEYLEYFTINYYFPIFRQKLRILFVDQNKFFFHSVKLFRINFNLLLSFSFLGIYGNLFEIILPFVGILYNFNNFDSSHF